MSEAGQFAPLERPRNLREAIMEQLRTAIVTGELAAGTVVSAPTLGKTFQVSATPVREAMTNLEREGLVETIKNKGFRITEMTEKDLDDLAAIRLLIEPPCMHHVIGRISQATFVDLERIANDCLTAAETQDLQAYLIHDRDFHALILSHTENPQLVELATMLRRRTRLYGLTALAESGHLGESAKEHHVLLQLLREGDAPGAERLLRKHIGHVRDIWSTGKS